MISVIVPIYNIETYIGTCIESIIEQSYTDLEIILVDDGSKDESGKICDRYAEKDCRIRVFHKRNGGLVSARKMGLLAARGDYISYVDGDDWLDTDMYQRLLDMGNGADIIGFSAYEEYGDGQIRGIKRNTINEGSYSTAEERNRLYSCMMVNGNFYESGVLVYLWSKLIKRDILLKCQMGVPESITYAEDVACTYPCLLEAGTIYVSNEPLYHYRVRSDSMVRSEIEIERMTALFRLLGNCFMTHPRKKVLGYQLRCFMWHTMLLKGYAQIRSPMILFPFEKVKDGMRVAIYGAGMFGNVIWKYCKASSRLILAGWFDKRYEVYDRQGLCVSPVSQISEDRFDIMVIAILNIRLARQIKENLVQRGICKDKIDYISMEALDGMCLPDYMERILSGKD